NVAGATVTDYIPHHEPFQYFTSTANPHHLPPSSVGMIGQTDQANHQYDLSDFWAAADAGNLPAGFFQVLRCWRWLIVSTRKCCSSTRSTTSSTSRPGRTRQ